MEVLSKQFTHALPIISKSNGNLNIIRFSQGQIVQHYYYNKLTQEPLKAHGIMSFKEKKYAIITQPDKTCTFVNIDSKNLQENNQILLKTVSNKRVKKLIEKNDTIYQLDKNGDIYDLSLEDNKIQYRYITQNLAIPTYFSEIFGYFVLGDNYYKIKVYEQNDLQNLLNIWVPFKGTLRNAVQFDNSCLMGFRFSDISQNLRQQAFDNQQQQSKQQQQQQKTEEQVEEDQMEQDEDVFQQQKKENEKQGRSWYEFYEMQKENFLDANFKGKKLFVLENARKVKTLKLTQQTFAIAYLNNKPVSDEIQEEVNNQDDQVDGNEYELKVELRDINGNIIKDITNQLDKASKINKSQQKIRLLQTGENNFALYVYSKNSEQLDKTINLTEIQNKESTNKMIQFTDEDFLIQFDF